MKFESFKLHKEFDEAIKTVDFDVIHNTIVSTNHEWNIGVGEKRVPTKSEIIAEVVQLGNNMITCMEGTEIQPNEPYYITGGGLNVIYNVEFSEFSIDYDIDFFSRMMKQMYETGVLTDDQVEEALTSLNA